MDFFIVVVTYCFLLHVKQILENLKVLINLFVCCESNQKRIRKIYNPVNFLNRV